MLLIRDGKNIKINVPLVLLPAGSKEGDILDITIQKDEKETREARERVASFIEKLKGKNAEGT